METGARNTLLSLSTLNISAKVKNDFVLITGHLMHFFAAFSPPASDQTPCGHQAHCCLRCRDNESEELQVREEEKLVSRCNVVVIVIC